jgi:acetate kinase
MKILVMNAGSSSQKSCLYEITNAFPPDPPQPLWECAIDWIHQQGKAELEVKTASAGKLAVELALDSHAEAIAYMLNTLSSGETKSN